jgi:hypothetical protein
LFMQQNSTLGLNCTLGKEKNCWNIFGDHWRV